MAQFATNAELAARLGITLTAAEQTRADSLLETASGLVQAEARQEVELVEGDTLTIRGSREFTILLPERPVVSVTSVTLDGEALAEDTDWYLDGDELVRKSGASPSTMLSGSPGRWGHPGVELVIVYTHGYAEAAIPDAVKAVVMEAAARVWVNPGAVMSERHGSEQVAYLNQGTPTGLLLTADEKRTVKRTLRRRSGSVNLR